MWNWPIISQPCIYTAIVYYKKNPKSSNIGIRTDILLIASEGVGSAEW